MNPTYFLLESLRRSGEQAMRRSSEVADALMRQKEFARQRDWRSGEAGIERGFRAEQNALSRGLETERLGLSQAADARAAELHPLAKETAEYNLERLKKEQALLDERRRALQEMFASQQRPAPVSPTLADPRPTFGTGIGPGDIGRATDTETGERVSPFRRQPAAEGAAVPGGGEMVPAENLLQMGNMYAATGDLSKALPFFKQAELQNRIRSGGTAAVPEGMVATGGTMDPLSGVFKTTYGERKMTESQAKASSFASRMLESENKIEALLKGDPEFDPTAIWREGVGKVIPSWMPGTKQKFTDETYQRFDNAARAFSLALLRRESGAAISDNERMEIGRTYFPQPGDTKELIEDKRRLREQAIRTMLAELPEWRQKEIDLFDQKNRDPRDITMGEAPQYPDLETAEKANLPKGTVVFVGTKKYIVGD